MDEKIIKAINTGEQVGRYLTNTASPDEEKEVESWANQSIKNRLLLDSISTDEEIANHVSNYNQINITKAWKQFNQKRNNTKKILFRTLLRYAAVITALFVIAAVLKLSLYHPSEKVQQTLVSIKPGGNKAILTLADGSKIVLDNAQNGKLAQQGNSNIIKLNNGKLIYSPNSLSTSPNIPISAFNTISTPTGGEYQLVLADGTKVWLNATSSITFPTVFNGKERKVAITGEVYFEVSHNTKMAFIVKKDNTEIRVLGTHFNINAYDDEATIKTTLLEGRVQVISLITHNSSTIQPGQQSSVDSQGKINVTDVNVDEAVAWKNGYFLFVNQNLNTIMHSMARWYGINVIYDDKEVQQMKFVVDIRKYENFDKVKEILELTEKLRFTVEGNTVHIKKRTL